MFTSSPPDVPQIDALDVKAATDAGKDIVLLDVRTPQEYAKDHIPGSVNIPVDTVAAEVEQKVPDKSKTIYAYCLSGTRSAHAVDMMIKLGYTNVKSMTSGILSWRAKNLPLTT